MAFLLGACHAEPQVQPEPSKKVSKKASASAKPAKKADSHPERGEAERGPETFTVPFAWEAAKDEPLALTRSFLREAFTDNEAYMERGEKFFAAFADKQTPRATVLTCADSRVHSQAWDRSPENDDFTVRDIGNQVQNVEGSVEYGVEHLHTPLLLIIGHTGCGAVKAAMSGTEISKLSEPIRKELEHLRVPPADASKAPEVAWAEAVVANVNHQVAFSIKRFNHEVHDGTLTVVGAVYDFRNDLRQGPGKLIVVNVNGNSDPERMESFVDAVNAGPRPREAKVVKAEGGTKPAKAENVSAPRASPDIAAELSKIRGISAQPSDSPPIAARETTREPSVHEH